MSLHFGKILIAVFSQTMPISLIKSYLIFSHFGFFHTLKHLRVSNLEEFDFNLRKIQLN